MTAGSARPRGVVLRGQVWAGGDARVLPEGVVVVAADGTVLRLGPATEVDVPPELPAYGGARHWVGPGIVDAHVHLAFGAPELALAGAVVALRDLGAPPSDAARWRAASGSAGQPVVAVAGPLLTAPGGYPSRSWGAAGFARFVATPAAARSAVVELADGGPAGGPVDVIKLALEPGGGQPVPEAATAAAVVNAAHDCGLAVTAHALSPAMVVRALDAGVDELCHIPTEPLPSSLVERVATAGIAVVSTLHTHAGGGSPASAGSAAVLGNAAALYRAGVPLCYGTDLGNAGTRPGAEPRELDLLARAGLGSLGALRAATDGAASTPGLPGRVTGRLEEGRPAYAVVLSGDPLRQPELWRRPVAVVTPAGVVSAPPG